MLKVLKCNIDVIIRNNMKKPFDFINRRLNEQANKKIISYNYRHRK